MNETTRHVYDPATIEPRWQAVWDEQGAFLTPEAPEELAARPKFYVLDMFPYPSGAGLHVGHPVGYTATDVIARAKRMQGYNVLHPMGWDAFGLPAERAAVREGRHPAEITRRNIETFRRQIRRLGMSYDWRREVDTSSPDYYRWTQWIFLKLYERGLAYMAEMPVNWCPALGTVLANEEVQGGRYVETGDPVERRLMRQWMLRITAYAERLLDDLDRVDWPAHVKEIQRNWIGRSEGAEITFRVDGGDERFEVFTTCPETLFGCTFCVLSPEHPLVPRITAAGERGAVEAYRRDAAAKSELERTDLAVEKTGVATGAFAVHPITGDKVPIWVADYVLMTYGTGSIMAVPGHDERDHDFARRFGLEIVRVIEGGGRDIEDEAWVGGGAMVASDFLDGMTVAEAKERMIGWLEEHGAGRRKVEYRLRDWLFSRQRYWGEPFPIVHTDDGETVGVAEDELPVELPRIDEHRPTDDGRPPLARAGDGWLRVALSDGRRATRETNTMPQWAGSCWYYLRYLDPQNRERIFSSAAERYWMPVDLYVGGGEHAVLHLLYARFWHKVLYDCGLVHTNEPFQRLYTQAMMHADSYQRSGKYYPPHEVEERGGRYYAGGEEVVKKLEKMSKSKLNVVNPDDVVEVHGADALRLFELFMGPLNQPKVWPENWRTESLQGIDRFLQRTWRLVVDEATGERSPRLAEAPASSEPALERTLHKTIRKVTRDTEALAMNTAVAQMMVFVNEATASATLPVEAVKAFVRLLAPYAPHLAEELWHRLGEGAVIAHAPWPDYDEELASDDEITVVVQVDGKKRDELRVPAGVDRATLERLALDSKRVGEHLGGAAPARVVVVPGRLVNLVTA